MCDVSLGTTARKGHIANVPGSPMCNCAKHMPVVESVSYRTASVTSGISCAFAHNPDTEYVSTFSSANVVYANYDGGHELKAKYVANQEGNAEKAALVNGHLVGKGGHSKDIEDYLNEVQYVGEATSTRACSPTLTAGASSLSARGPTSSLP